jgi:hypothetical protein
VGLGKESCLRSMPLSLGFGLDRCMDVVDSVGREMAELRVAMKSQKKGMGLTAVLA